MGKLKQSLSEDLDVTDLRDRSGEIEDEIPSDEEIAVYRYCRAVNELVELGATKLMFYADELSDADVKLASIMDEIIALAKRPF